MGLRARDEDALAEAMARHSAAVHRMARTVFADEATAEEIVQDVFLDLWRRPERFDRGRGSLQTFLVGMARNKAIDRLRTFYVRRKMLDSLTDMAGITARRDEHDVVEVRSDLSDQIGKLPGPQREALTLAYYGGRTYKEVALELGIPEGTAKTRLRHALTKLRAMLQETEMLVAAGEAS